jgi:integrase
LEWIEDPGARRSLETLELHARDRFLIDLLYYTGIRVGEALSLFCGDIHFGGGSPELGCRTVDPHFHVVMGNDTENGARSKGAERTLHVSSLLVERYVDYMLERSAVLGVGDHSKHVFVNLYDRENDYLWRAMTYSNAYDLVKRVGDKIGVPLTRPHMLRHTFATRLVRGIDCDRQDLDVVQYLLGHRRIESTRLYTHGLEPAAKIALAALVPRAIELRPTE